MSGLKDRVKSLQTDTSNTDTALGTLEEALSEKVHTHRDTYLILANLSPTQQEGYINKITMSEDTDHPRNSQMIL